jgi:hypothetical protein
MSPISFETFSNIPFEYVLIPSSSLAKITCDYTPFAEKISHSTKLAVSFGNLSGKSRLVVPTLLSSKKANSDIESNIFKDFSHLTKFMRTAYPQVIAELWCTVAIQALKYLENNPQSPLWISTSGLGVSWLHVRLDTVPKYYNWEEYKFFRKFQ